MNKIKILLLILLLSITFIACTANQDDIKFYLNPGNDTVEINSVYVDPSVTAKVFNITRSTEVVDNTVNTSEIGVYHITYNFLYKDFDLTLIRIVTVVDETPPEVILNPGVDTIKVGQTWEDASISVFDNSGGKINVSTSGSVNSELVGTYIITYIATDPSGNESSISRYINVIE